MELRAMTDISKVQAIVTEEICRNNAASRGGAPAAEAVSVSRVIVCGSRSWELLAPIEKRLFQLPPDTVIVHGDARGADRLAARVARALGLVVEAHPADWTRHGRTAGPRRNAEMLAAGADLVIAFRARGESRGTDGMVALARRAGVPVEVHAEDGTVTT